MKNLYYDLRISDLKKDLKNSYIPYLKKKTIERPVKDTDGQIDLDVSDVGSSVSGILVFSSAPIILTINLTPIPIRDVLLMSLTDAPITQLSIQTTSVEEINVEVTLLGN